MPELETRHSIPSYGYSFFVDNESGYEFTATLTFEPNWWNSAPGYNIEVLDPEGRILHKEYLECVDFKDKDVFHGPSYDRPDGVGPLLYPDYESIFPNADEPVTVTVPIPATETGGVYQIRIITPYTSINGDGRMSTVDLTLDPPLPYGWKGDMGFTDLCLKGDRSSKSGSVYFCSLPPGIIDDTDENAGIKQWIHARGFGVGSVGFDVEIFKDGDDVPLKVMRIEREVVDGNTRRSWPVHSTTTATSSLTLDYSISGPEYLKNDPTLPREVYRIDWVNLDDEDEDDLDHAFTLLLETHEATEVVDQETNDYNLPVSYARQGATDVPLILCSDRNTAIRLNNGISYEYDEELADSGWDSKRITFLNANQRAAWQKLKQARQDYKLNIFDQDLVNTQDDPYWIGRPGIDSEGGDWDYAGAMQKQILTNIQNDQNYWGEDKLNRLSNAVTQPGLFEFLPCHIYEQHMDPTSPWFGVFWNWHKNVHEEINIGGSDPHPLGNPYSSIFRYLHAADGSIYSNWKDQEFPRLGPSTCNLGRPLARMYSLGDTREDLGLGFLRDANPFYKNVGIRNRLVLALLHQLMSFDQNGDNTFFNNDYRGGSLSFTTNAIIPLLDVWEDIGTTDDDIFIGDDAIDVKEIIKTGIMNNLERYAGYLQCSQHNQWTHAWIAMAKAAACFNDSSIDYLFLRNIKISDNRYNHNVATWQESGGYDNSYCLFAIYSISRVRGFLLKRRDYIIDNGEGDDVLRINELTLRDLESQINDLTDYWNHTIVIEPDGSVAGCHDFNSRTDGAQWGTLPRRFLEYIGPAYGDTITIPEMTACQSLVAWTTGRNYEVWNDMYRKWQHNVVDPYDVSFDFDVDNDDGTSIDEKRQWILDKMILSGDNQYSPTRFREPFTSSNGALVGLAGRGINPSATISAPRPVGSDWMDKDDNTLVMAQGPAYAEFGISPESLSDEVPPPLPAHGDPFVKLWPAYSTYWNQPNGIYAYTNQKNVAPNSATRQDIGGISVKTSKYYCHIHADGWNLSNQNSDWNSRRGEITSQGEDQNKHDPEYMWALTASAGGGFSLFTTPENGSVLCGRRRGWLGSNQIYMKRYMREDGDEGYDSDVDTEEWNAAITADGCGYAWAEPASDNATAEWDEEPVGGDLIGTFTHKQHFNRNFLAKPTDLAYSHTDNPSFEDVALEGGIGYIERTYEFYEDNVECTVKIVPKRNVEWDDIYMTLPITLMGRGYYSGDGQYVQNEDARKNKNRYNGEGNLPIKDPRYGDKFETEKGGCWKKEVFIAHNKVTIGHRHFNTDGTEISFSSGVVDNIDRLVSGPGTDPLYPQQQDTEGDPGQSVPLEQNGNFFWPPSQETLDLQPQLGKFGDVDNLLEYCNGGRDQTDLPQDWCVPAPSGYHSRTFAGTTTDDALRVHFNDSVKNWTFDQPIEFSFTLTPGKNLDVAEEESSSTSPIGRSILITDWPDLIKEEGGYMVGVGYLSTPQEASPGQPDDFSHMILTRDLITDQSGNELPCHPVEWVLPGSCPFGDYTDPVPGLIFGNPNGEKIKGKGKVHVFADLDFRPKDVEWDTLEAAGYVRGEACDDCVEGCIEVPVSGNLGWHMAMTVLRTGLPMGGFPYCDFGKHTFTLLQERVHLEFEFDSTDDGAPEGDDPESWIYSFWLHLHETRAIAVADSGFASIKDIVIRIDFDEVENPEWWD